MVRRVATIPRPPSIDDKVDGERKSPDKTTADGFGDKPVKNICNLGRFASSYTSLMEIIRRRAKVVEDEEEVEVDRDIVVQ